VASLNCSCSLADGSSEVLERTTRTAGKCKGNPQNRFSATVA
jgi:hypothetical protein